MADQVVERFANGQGFVRTFSNFISMEVLRVEVMDEVVVVTRWRDKADFKAWVASDAFKMAHGRGGGGLLRGHPQMGTYEDKVEREARAPED